MLNVTEVKQRSAGRDRQQKRSRKRQHVRDGAGRASWGSFLIGVWFVFLPNRQVTGHAAIDFILLLYPGQRRSHLFNECEGSSSRLRRRRRRHAQ
jgi:hypothetical protein